MHDSDVPVSAVPVPAGPDGPAPDATSDAAWLCEAYDSFAEALYAYCRSLVREPAAAADAVQDTFVVTAFRLGELPEEGLLRAWLHAVARNDCLRAIASGRATPALGFLPEDAGAGGAVPGATAGAAALGPAGGESAAGAADEAGTAVAADEEASTPAVAGADEPAETTEARALLRASLGGLEPAERDVMIMTWHGLNVAECSAVLGISHDQASKVLFRGRDQLEVSAGVMTVARSPSHECAQLNDMLAGWEGQLTPALSTQLRQHIDHCDICSDQRRTGMRPAILLRLAPDTLRGISAGTSALTAWVTSRLREQALAAAFDTEPDSFEHRAMVVRRSGPYRADGFPVPVDPPGARATRKHRSPAPLVLAGAGGTGLLAVAVIAGLALSANHSTGALPAWAGLAQSATSSARAGSTASASSSASAGARASATPHRSTATPSATAGGKFAEASGLPSATAPARLAPSKPYDPVPTVSSAHLGSAKIGVSPASLRLSPDRNGGYAGWLQLINPTGSDMPWSISLPQGLATWGNMASGTLPPNSSNTRLLIYTDGGGHQQQQQDQAQTRTITLQPGNVQVTVTIP